MEAADCVADLSCALVAADVSRRCLGCDMSAPTNVGGYTVSVGHPMIAVVDEAPTR
jgi:hypothetical protein